MFTGIITAIGTIRSSSTPGDRRVIIESAQEMTGVAIGASIACSGACMTVVDKGADWFAADVSGESVSRTAAGMWDQGARLNLERALRIGDELGGHIVTGHVDGVGMIVSIDDDGGSHRVAVAVPHDVAPFIAAKGSVTVDGVSLTVNLVTDTAAGTHFTVNIIPHTWAITTLGDWAVGRAVNIEIDILARYLSRMRDVMAR
jgi:riboflavin synthase